MIFPLGVISGMVFASCLCTCIGVWYRIQLTPEALRHMLKMRKLTGNILMVQHLITGVERPYIGTVTVPALLRFLEKNPYNVVYLKAIDRE